MTPLFALLFDSLDERLRLRRPGRMALNKVFPSHWSFLLGEVALFMFVVLVLTGIFLTMFYSPSVQPVTYTGSYELHHGREVPAAFASILELSHDVPGGLFFRRLHRGAAYLFVASVVLHQLRVLLTGAFRRPREVNYHIGIVLLMLTVALAATGQALPYDAVEGAALRIAYTFLLGVPFVGEQLSFWIFGGAFFGDAIPRFYVLHILILPMILAGLVSAHLAIMTRQRHTQFPRAGVDGQRYVHGRPLWPSHVSVSTALLLGASGVLALAAGSIPWSDVSLHGAALPGRTPSGAHPDWWLFWMEGALTLWPAWEWHPVPGMVVNAPFIAGFVVPGLVFGGLIAYPFIDRRLAPAEGDLHVLQRPLDVPARAGVVLGATAFVVVLSMGANVDVLSHLLHTPARVVTTVLQTAVLVVPLLVFALTVYAGRRRQRLQSSD